MFLVLNTMSLFLLLDSEEEITMHLHASSLGSRGLEPGVTQDPGSIVFLSYNLEEEDRSTVSVVSLEACVLTRGT